MAGVTGLKDKLTGWHVVALAFIGSLLIGWLVHEGETLGVIITGILGVLGALGYSIAQGQENKNLANGNLSELRSQITTLIQDHAAEMARKDAQFSLERSQLQSHIKEANDKAAMYAAMAPPDQKLETGDGLARL